MTSPIKQSTIVDFLNGSAVAVLVPNHSVDALTNWHGTTEKGKQDLLDLFHRPAVETQKGIVFGAEKEKAHAVFFIPTQGSTQVLKRPRELCSLGNAMIAEARRVFVERKLAELDAERAALAAQLEG